MTERNSICIQCKNLNVFLNTINISANGTKSLISDCLYGGINAGNRKTCKDFEKAEEQQILDRIACFKEYGNNENT